MRFFVLLLMSIFFFSACQKKEGCTDITAVNYDAEAEVNNGTCKYCNLEEPAVYGIFWKSQDPTELELQYSLENFPHLHAGCSVAISISHAFSSEETTIQWEPAEIFDCSSCKQVIMTPLETTQVTLQIDTEEGYYFLKNFQVSVL